MGISVEFNPDLALRNWEQFKNWNCRREECIPEKLEAGKEYEFLKTGQRLYWLLGEIPLCETKGGGQLSRPKASIVITEVRHLIEEGKLCTRGRYKVVEVFSDDKIHFDGWAKVK
ncbi:MAG: hypothetical protein FJY76_00120 [Candidatus Aenigmarchaeota archaeon]|nr:hypothetical protein [Candidatus Aenigmarchaeota archaeon]